MKGRVLTLRPTKGHKKPGKGIYGFASTKAVANSVRKNLKRNHRSYRTRQGTLFIPK